MKILYYTIIAILIFSASSYLKPIQAENQNNILIVNPQTSSPIRVGDMFTINATLVNNSTNTITVKNGCGGPFSIAFDGHAKVEVKKVCNWMAIQIILHPGENITGSSLASNLAYRAIESGTANATITFSYTIDSKTSNLSFDNNTASISKLFSYEISNQSNETIHGTYSPLKQFKSGIAAHDVTCNKGLQLIIKSRDNSPACVKPDTASQLVQRGWAKSPENVFVTLVEGQRENPLLVQKIFSDNIQGLSFREFPLVTNVGNPITLHIGDSVSNGCTIELTLVKISHGTATFLKKENLTRLCPLCLSENTIIGTPNGPGNIKNLKTGMTIFTQDSSGNLQTGTILKTGRTLAPPGHMMVHVVLSDKRELYVSPNHPTADGRFFGELLVGDTLDGSKIKNVEHVPYNGTYTYDILPSGQTGFYWANGILVESTLK